MNRDEKIIELLSQYKELIQQSRLKDERYKWELIKRQEGKPNLDAPYFEKEILEMDYQNLVYYNAKTVLRAMVEKRPIEAKNCLRILFNNKEELNARIAKFQDSFLKMYRDAEPEHTMQHHQDERTIATYLAIKFPKEYTFYKYTFYKEYCNYLDIPSAKTGEQYSHYISLVTELLEYLKKDAVLIPMVNDFLGDLTSVDPNHLLLAQDILFQVFELNKQQEIEKVQGKFKKDEIKKYIGMLQNMVEHFNLAYDDPRVTYNVRNDRLIFVVGQRYGLVLYKSGSKTYILALSPIQETEQFDKFAGIPPHPFLNYYDIKDINSIKQTNLFQAIESELKRTTKSSFKRFENIEFKNLVYDKDTEEESNKEETMSSKQPLNQILYGPPGTGKTYHLQHKFFPKYTTTYESITFEQYLTNLVQNLSWWQVIGIALLEKNNSKVTDILENRWVSKKAEISESKDVRATIWGTLQMHTITESSTVNYKQRQQPLIFDKNKDKTWAIYEEEVKDLAPELLEHIATAKNFTSAHAKTIKRYEFITFHQSFSYEDFVEGIKPIIIDEGEAPGEIQYEVKSGVFKTLCKRAENDPDNDYALFIDEINRGNVSAIFGELITLIEEDKRKGNANELTLKLPYSRSDFSVPNNLYIIGTMNTADRSVEALDTALRRRFSFEEIAPDPSFIRTEGAAKESNGIVEEVDLVQVLSIINQRIEKLIDKDHQIGHAFFMNVFSNEELIITFENKIIPLLQEYFYGDYGKIGLVLGSSFIEKIENNIEFADFKGIDSEISRDISNKPTFKFKDKSEWDFRSIYEPVTK